MVKGEGDSAGEKKMLNVTELYICKRREMHLQELFVAFVEIQNVRLWNTFRGKKKSLAVCRFCSIFAVEFAKKIWRRIRDQR